ncbi:ATP-dependent RNA helicase [Hyphodiscus hymeniophilus]|uniref:RNA helicase n=1 Tax=Hyphodiscus hymeniophilus TaxID=353542 RepID=A0A9P6VH24_9HELO|nr:ATP-dependent RNA helicase [Hyphodiscus hymeniophilus]
MLRPKTSKCLLCSFREARKAQKPRVVQWQPTASFQLKFHPSDSSNRPSRMGLAQPREVGMVKSRNRRAQDGPFGGMNQKAANIRGIPERRSDSQEKRDSRFGGFKEKKLDKDFKALKMQRSLAVVSYDHRMLIKKRIQEGRSQQSDTFQQFDLLPSVEQSILPQVLTDMEDVKPTPVQRITIPALLGTGGRDASGRRRRMNKDSQQQFLIAAETGSGKTLSYLIPTINAVKLAEAEDAEIEAHEQALKEEKLRQNDLTLVSPPLSNMPHPTTGRPRAIILVPTAELVEQVGSVVKSFSHTVKFRSAVISSTYSGTVIRNRLFSPGGIDILVSTPHLLSSIADSDPNILSRVSHLIIDEADSLLDRGFSPLTSAIIDRASPSLKQLILCSATIPRSLDSFLRKRFPAIQRLVTPNLHAIPRRVQLGVVDVERDPYRGNKDLACADTIWSIGKAAADHEGPVKDETDVKRILVFVNEREKTEELTKYLQSKGVDATALTRDTAELRQSEMLASFTSASPLVVRKGEHPGSLSENQPNYLPPGHVAPAVKRKLPNTKVLVTTDLGSRGIDTLAVRTVILYDVPHSTIDFIHRLGRTGRMGRRGRGIVLVGKHDRRDVVAEVKDGMFKGQALI